MVIVKHFPFWFVPRFAEFTGQVERIPFDQHEVKALVAPRAYFSTEALGDLWANPEGTQVTWSAAREVFKFLGADDKIGIHFREGKHEQNEEDFAALLDFADHQFFGKKPAQDFTKLAFPDAPKPWSWTAPPPVAKAGAKGESAVCDCCDTEAALSIKPATRPATRPVHVHRVPQGTELKLAIVTNNASDYWKVFAFGVREYEKKAGVKIDILMPPSGRIQEQNGMIEDLVAKGYHGIAVSAISPEDQKIALNAAAAKLNLVCFDSDAPDSDRIAYVGTDNVAAGRVMGRQIAKLLPAGGKVATFCGVFAAKNATERLRGINEALADTKAEVVTRLEDQTDRAKALVNVENVVNGPSGVTLLCGLWSYNGPAIATAIDRGGMRGKIKAVAFDEEDGTLGAIENGTIDATIVQDSVGTGSAAAMLLHRLATEGEAAVPKGGTIDTGVRVIDKTNVKEFREKLKQMRE